MVHILYIKGMAHRTTPPIGAFRVVHESMVVDHLNESPKPLIGNALEVGHKIDGPPMDHLDHGPPVDHHKVVLLLAFKRMVFIDRFTVSRD